MTKHGSVMKFSKINNNIYLGTNSCCKVHFDKKLLKKGISIDISMEKERIDQPWGVKSFLWLPTKDTTAPTFKQLISGSAFIDAAVKNGDKIYIHCKNGHGRAPTMTAAYLITRGLDVKEAIEKIKKKRPEIHLNAKQISALNSFAKKYK